MKNNLPGLCVRTRPLVIRFLSPSLLSLFLIFSSAHAQSPLRIEAGIGSRIPTAAGEGTILNFIPTGSVAPAAAIISVSPSDDILLTANVNACEPTGNGSMQTSIAKQTWWKRDAAACTTQAVTRVDEKLGIGNTLGFPNGTILTSSSSSLPALSLTASGNVVMDTVVRIPILNSVPQQYTSERWFLCQENGAFRKLMKETGASVLDGPGPDASAIGIVTDVERVVERYDSPEGCSILILASVDYGTGPVTHVLLRATNNRVVQAFPGRLQPAPGIPMGSFNEALGSPGIISSNEHGDAFIIRPVLVSAPAQTFDAAYRSRHNQEPELLVHEQQIFSSGPLNGVRISSFLTSYPNPSPTMNRWGEVALWTTSLIQGSSVNAIWTNRNAGVDLVFKANTPMTNPADASDQSFKFVGLSRYGILDDGTIHVWGRVSSLLSQGSPGAVSSANDAGYFTLPADEIQILMREGDTVLGQPQNTRLAPDAFVHTFTISPPSSNYGSTPVLESAQNSCFVSRLGDTIANPALTGLVVPAEDGIHKVLAINDELPQSSLIVDSLNSTTLRLSPLGQILIEANLSRADTSRHSLLYFDENRERQLLLREGDAVNIDSANSGSLADVAVHTQNGPRLSDSGMFTAGLYLTAPGNNRRMVVSFKPDACPVEVSCRADYNSSGSVTVQDIFDFLTGYFNQSADFNHDCIVSVQDIFDFLGAYFAGC